MPSRIWYCPTGSHTLLIFFTLSVCCSDWVISIHLFINILTPSFLLSVLLLTPSSEVFILILEFLHFSHFHMVLFHTFCFFAEAFHLWKSVLSYILGKVHNNCFKLSLHHIIPISLSSRHAIKIPLAFVCWGNLDCTRNTLNMMFWDWGLFKSSARDCYFCFRR